MTRHVIVGSGVAGIAAAETLRTLDRSADITIVSEDPYGFYSRPGLAYFLSEELPERQLYVFSKEDWRRLNTRFVQARATRLLPQEYRLELGEAGSLTYDRLLLATGSTAVRLNIPGSDLQGVVKLDTFEDTRRIIALARRARSAVVIGGGIIAVELVEGLRAQGLKVHFFLRGDRYWPNVLDEKESRFVEQRLAEHGILLHYKTEAAEILGKRGKVAAVRTTDGQVIHCEIVAAGIGVKPRLELAQAAGLATERGILVDEYLRTSHPDIFAAGDTAQVFDPLTGASSIDTLWDPARQQGRAAARNMVGGEQAFRRGVAVNVLRLAGVMIAIIGSVGTGEEPLSTARGSSETWRHLPNTIAVASGGGVNQVRLTLGEQTLLGAVVMGEQTLSHPLREIILNQVDITPIRAQMLQPSASLGQLVMDFWYHASGKAL
ncbi:MAG: FAD-dependent oxidoreductase [Chloroflexota bacterium]